MINNKETARPAKKQLVTDQAKDKFNPANQLSKIEGIITSPIKLKEPREAPPYFWAFFQLEGIDQDIPVIFRLKDNSECPDCENAKTLCQAFRGQHAQKKCEDCQEPHCEDCPGPKPVIPPRSKVLLEGH